MTIGLYSQLTWILKTAPDLFLNKEKHIFSYASIILVSKKKITENLSGTWKRYFYLKLATMQSFHIYDSSKYLVNSFTTMAWIMRNA